MKNEVQIPVEKITHILIKCDFCKGETKVPLSKLDSFKKCGACNKPLSAHVAIYLGKIVEGLEVLRESVEKVGFDDDHHIVFVGEIDTP